MNKIIILLLMVILIASCSVAQRRIEDKRVCTIDDFNKVGPKLLTPLSLDKEVEESTESLNLVELNFLLKRLSKAEGDCDLLKKVKVDCKLKIDDGIYVDGLESAKTACYGLINKARKTVEEKIKMELRK